MKRTLLIFALSLFAMTANAQYFPTRPSASFKQVKIFGKNVVDSVPINKGGTASKTRQAAIDTLTNVSQATTGWVLTDSSSHAVWQAAAGGGSSKQVLQVVCQGRWNPAQNIPLSGYSNGGNGVTRSVANNNVTIFNIGGTLQKWTLAVDGLGTTDTMFVYKSSNQGSTWTATTLKVIMTGVAIASDNTHTSTVTAGDWYSIFYGFGGEDLLISNCSSVIEFDPN